MKELLSEEVKAQLEGVQNLELGSGEHSAAVKSIDTLTKDVIEINKLETEKQNKEDERKQQSKLETEKLDFEKKKLEKQIELDTKKLEFDQKKLDKQIELDNLKMELDKQERANREYLQDKQLELQQKQFELQEQQHKENKRNNTLQIAIAVGTLVLGAAIKVWGTDKCLKFEEEGTITTTPGKFHVGSLFNKK